MDDGSGLGSLYPPVAASDYLKSNAEKIPCIIKNGLAGEISVNGKKYNGQNMIGFPNLNEVEITNLINFLNTNFGNKIPTKSLAEVKKSLENCPK
jgi:hypothetical protein